MAEENPIVAALVGKRIKEAIVKPRIVHLNMTDGGMVAIAILNDEFIFVTLDDEVEEAAE